MKTSVLIQSLARWISEIATTMIWRCFKGKSSLLLKTPISHLLFTELSLIISLSLTHTISFFISPSFALFSSLWHPEMNRCCHRDSCSLSAFKQTVGKRITSTGNLPVWGEVISHSLLCPVRVGNGIHPVTKEYDLTHAHTFSYTLKVPLWITDSIRLLQ